MSDTAMDGSDHFNDSTDTPKLYISDRPGDALGSVHLTLEILPAFNLHSTETVLVELFIDGNKRGQSLIKGSSPDWKTTFTVSEKYLRASQRDGSHVHEAGFHITHGILIRPTFSEPKSLIKIKGSTYKVLHQLATQILHEEDHRDNSDVAERNQADDPVDKTSQEHFYDARSQFEILQDTSTAEEDPAVGDLPADEEDSRAEDLTAAANDPPAEHGFYDARSQFEHVRDTPTAEEDPIIEDLAGPGGSSLDGDECVLGSSGTGNTASINAGPTDDNPTRLDHAKRVLFLEDDSSVMEPFTASSPSPVHASSPSVQDPDAEMLDDLAINSEQSQNDDIAPSQKKPMQTFGTISEYLSSNKSAAQHGINSDSFDANDEAASLIRNPKPLTLRRTSFAPPGTALLPDIPDQSLGRTEAQQASLNGRDDSDTGDDETAATATSLKKRKDPAKQKAYNANWRASGARVKGDLQKRLADNDEKIGVKGAVLKLWRGKNLGDNRDINAANIRLENVIKKQVKLHNLLIACTDADAASELRQSLQPWVKGGQLDVYESQLDAVFSIVQGAPSTDLTAHKQRADSDPAEDSDDDFALPLMSSQQRGMAAALLSDDQPVRKATETAVHGHREHDQEVNSSTPPTMHSRDNDMPEDSEDDELPDPSALLTPRLLGGIFAKTQPARDAGKSAERPKKKPRME